MKQIHLTQGKTTFVDDADFSALSLFRWSAQRTLGGKYHAVRKLPFTCEQRGKGEKRVTVGMHRQIALSPLTNPVPYYLDAKYKHLRVFHNDGDGLNNTRQNLKVYAVDRNQGDVFNPATGLWEPWKPGAVPPGVVLSSRRVKLSKEEMKTVVIEGTNERILYARDWGATRYTGYIVDYVQVGQTYHDAVGAYIELYCSPLSEEQRAADPLFILYDAAVAAGVRITDPVIPDLPPRPAEAPSALSVDDLLGGARESETPAAAGNAVADIL